MGRILPPLAVALASAFACGRGELTVAEFPGAFAHALDARSSFCRAEAAYLERKAEQDDAHLYSDDLPRAIQARRASFDPAAAQRCVDGLAARECGRIPSAVLQACFAATPGLVATGGACFWQFECAQGFCTRGNGGCPSTCAPVVPPGGTCPGANSAQCDGRAGFGCVNSVCKAPLVEGEACAFTSNCQPALFCNAASVCARRGGAQASCDADEQCSPGLYCRLTSAGGLCEAKALAGKPCGQDADHAMSAGSQCADGLLCQGFILRAGAPSPGACTAAGEVGAPCKAGADVTGCARGLDCVADRCAMPPSTGPCVNGGCLAGTAFCDAGGQCRPVLANGSACGDRAQCQSGYCPRTSGTCEDLPDLRCHEP